MTSKRNGQNRGGSRLNFRGLSHARFDRLRGQKLPGGIDGTSYHRIAKAMETPQRIQRSARAAPDAAPTGTASAPGGAVAAEMVFVGSLEGAAQAGFQRLGSRLYKRGHAIWELRHAEDGQGYLLVRKHEERAVDLRARKSARKTASKREAIAPALAAGARWLLTNPRAWMLLASAYPMLKDIWTKFQNGQATMADAEQVVQQLGPEVLQTFMSGGSQPATTVTGRLDRIEWRQVNGVEHSGRCIEVDANVGIVDCDDGIRRAVELTDDEINRFAAAGIDGAYRREGCMPEDGGDWMREPEEIPAGEGPKENHPADSYGTEQREHGTAVRDGCCRKARLHRRGGQRPEVLMRRTAAQKIAAEAAFQAAQGHKTAQKDDVAAEYWDEVESLAKSRFDDYGDQSEDVDYDYAFELVDGHQWIIYTTYHQDVLNAASDPDYGPNEGLCDMSQGWQQAVLCAAFFAFLNDVQQKIYELRQQGYGSINLDKGDVLYARSDDPDEEPEVELDDGTPLQHGQAITYDGFDMDEHWFSGVDSADLTAIEADALKAALDEGLLSFDPPEGAEQAPAQPAGPTLEQLQDAYSAGNNAPAGATSPPYEHPGETEAWRQGFADMHGLGFGAAPRKTRQVTGIDGQGMPIIARKGGLRITEYAPPGIYIGETMQTGYIRRGSKVRFVHKGQVADAVVVMLNPEEEAVDLLLNPQEEVQEAIEDLPLDVPLADGMGELVEGVPLDMVEVMDAEPMVDPLLDQLCPECGHIGCPELCPADCPCAACGIMDMAVDDALVPPIDAAELDAAVPAEPMEEMLIIEDIDVEPGLAIEELGPVGPSDAELGLMEEEMGLVETPIDEFIEINMNDLDETDPDELTMPSDTETVGGDAFEPVIEPGSEYEPEMLAADEAEEAMEGYEEDLDTMYGEPEVTSDYMAPEQESESEGGFEDETDDDGMPADEIPGGPEPQPDSAYDPDELAMGTAEETEEHTDGDADVGEEIAKDHLSEDPDYYSEESESEGGDAEEEDEERRTALRFRAAFGHVRALEAAINASLKKLAADFASDFTLGQTLMVSESFQPLEGPMLEERDSVTLTGGTRAAPGSDEWYIYGTNDAGQDVTLSLAQFNSPALEVGVGTMAEPAPERPPRAPKPRGPAVPETPPEIQKEQFETSPEELNPERAREQGLWTPPGEEIPPEQLPQNIRDFWEGRGAPSEGPRPVPPRPMGVETTSPMVGPDRPLSGLETTKLQR